MTNQSFIKHFASISGLTEVDAYNYVANSDYCVTFEVRNSIINKIRAFLDRYESSQAMAHYYASYGVSYNYYLNAILLEGALIDAQS